MGNVWAVLREIAISLRDLVKSLPPVARHALAGFVVACLWSLDKRYHYIPDDLREPVMVVLAALGFGVVRQGTKTDTAEVERKVDKVEQAVEINTSITAQTQEEIHEVQKTSNSLTDKLVHEVRTASLAKGKEDERLRQLGQDMEDNG